ncbi:MAG TPA: hypothetical protein VIM48_01250, partial [Chthoniobacterales bacterium]
ILHPHVGRTHDTNETPHYAVTLGAICVFVLPAILLYFKLGVLDVFNDLSTIATYGFLLVYIGISVAAPVYLKSIGKLTAGSIALSIVSVLFMLPPLVATVYPPPAPPVNAFPYYFLGYLLVGGLWFAYLRFKSSKVVEEIKSDLEMIHTRFNPSTD